MTELKGKVALVTGASSGIGAAIVKTLLSEGMKVVGLARRVEKVRELGVGYEDQLFPLQGDVTNKEDLNRVFQWIQDNVGPLDVLVNNAGVVYNENIDQCETEGIEKVLNTNLLGLILYTREAIRSMKANNIDGTIINICSVAGQYLLKFPRTSIYQASKFGATAFTENLRAELAGQKSKIRITSINPGIVESEITAGFFEQTPHLKGKDVGAAVKFILTQPLEVNISELTIRPTGETV